VGLVLPLAVEKLARPADSALDNKSLVRLRYSSAAKAREPESGSDSLSEPEVDHRSHGHVDALLDQRRLGPVMVLLAALSFHSVLEGLAQGAATSLSMSATLLLVIMLHKGLAAFALGCLFIKAGLSRRRSSILGLGFAAATPLGIAAGVALHAGLEGVAWVSYCVALASGSFCYVALLEVMPAELDGGRATARAQLVALSLGFALMAALAQYV
jgi:zinc transporter ZupT